MVSWTTGKVGPDQNLLPLSHALIWFSIPFLQGWKKMMIKKKKRQWKNIPESSFISSPFLLFATLY